MTIGVWLVLNILALVLGIWVYAISMGQESNPIQTWVHEQIDTDGEFGEYLTLQELKGVPGEKVLLQNVFIPWKGKSTEIDVLMIHEKGICVFESKNFSGCIYGSEDDLYWTQYVGGKKSQFYNPIKQNETHIKALAELLGLPEDTFSSYVVFSDRCELRKIPHGNERIKIMHRNNMRRLLDRQLREAPRQFGYVPTELAEKVRAAMPDRSMKDHIADLQTKCPYCGGTLVKRYSQKTRQYFLGCSGYPQCHYMRSLDEDERSIYYNGY